MSSLKSRIVQAILLITGITLAGSLWAQSREQIIAERLQAPDRVCLQGEDCSAGGSSMTMAQADSGEFSPEAVYENNCAMCHNTGMANAPQPDDADHWNTRLEEAGLDGIVTNAINGVNAMPPRGMCTDCTDDEIRQVVEFIMQDVL